MYQYLYLHVPFCQKICFYCDFFRIKKTRVEMIDDYLKFLAQEINNNCNILLPKTIYLGGGTPNCLSDDQLEMLLLLLKKINQSKLQEYTIELNPEHITSSQLLILKKFNVNRLSIGVQTSNNILLKKINRQHTINDVINGYKLARSLGFNNISFDLMYNLFDQNKADILNDIAFVKQLCPDHISWYSLILKPDSFWGKKNLILPEHDDEYDEIINNALEQLGYVRYEVSNYSYQNLKPSIHNLGYWNNESFFPLGPGACGFSNFSNCYFLINNSRQHQLWKSEKTILSSFDYYFQILMMGLRLVKGINLEIVKDAHLAVSFFWDKIKLQINKKNLVLNNNFLVCTIKGFNFLNDILVSFLD